MYRRRIMLSIFFVLLSCGMARAADPAAKIIPEMLIHPTSVLQPYTGTAQFVGKPGLAKPCNVMVNVTCIQTVPGPERIRLEAIDACGLVISPDSVIWDSPVDSGETRSAQFVFQPEEVGRYQLNVLRRLDSAWQLLTTLSLAISEDGKTKYAGSNTECHLNSIPPHPRRDANPLTVRFPLRGPTFDPMIDRHFTGEFRFSQPPAVDDTVYVDFALECQVPQYSKVQFVLDYSTSLRLWGFPRSWGDVINLSDSSRFYSGGFWFVPIRSGIGVLNLSIVGKRVSTDQFDRATTELPVYFVTGDDGQLLFIGSFEPWTRYKSKSDPMLGGLSRLLDVKNRDYVLRHVLSKPDYQGEEISMPVDSKATDKK